MSNGIEENEIMVIMSQQKVSRLLFAWGALFALLCLFPDAAFAEDGKTEVDGRVYTFDKDSRYEFSDSSSFAQSEAGKTYGNVFHQRGYCQCRH